MEGGKESRAGSSLGAVKAESLYEDFLSSHSAQCSIGGIGRASAMTDEAVYSGKLSSKSWASN